MTSYPISDGKTSPNLLEVILLPQAVDKTGTFPISEFMLLKPIGQLASLDVPLIALPAIISKTSPFSEYMKMLVFSWRDCSFLTRTEFFISNS